MTVSILIFLAGCGKPEGEKAIGTEPAKDNKSVEARTIVRWPEVSEKVLGPRCVICHFEKNPDHLSDFSQSEAVKAAIGPIYFLTVAKPTMPPPPSKLSPGEMDILSHWIVDGMLL